MTTKMVWTSRHSGMTQFDANTKQSLRDARLSLHAILAFYSNDTASETGILLFGRLRTTSARYTVYLNWYLDPIPCHQSPEMWEMARMNWLTLTIWTAQLVRQHSEITNLTK
jgi:hypothetical protein